MQASHLTEVSYCSKVSLTLLSIHVSKNAFITIYHVACSVVPGFCGGHVAVLFLCALNGSTLKMGGIQTTFLSIASVHNFYVYHKLKLNLKFLLKGELFSLEDPECSSILNNMKDKVTKENFSMFSVPAL